MRIESEISKERSDIDVSIIINVHNQPLSLKLALRSLMAQDYKGFKEVIVVDDGSNAGLFSGLHEDFKKAEIPIRYVWQQDKGMRELNSFNNGIKLAKGNYLIFLAGDMVPNLDFVSKHVKSHIQPKLIVAGNRNWRGLITPIVFQSLDSKPIKVVLNNLEHNWQVDELSKKREIGENDKRKMWLGSKHSWKACFACNLSIPNNPEVMFDENYFGWGNYDQELTYRLSVKHGYTPVYREDIHAYHLESPEAIANVFRTQKHEDIVNYIKNTFHFFDKCPGLELEDAFFGFARLDLDMNTNKWRVLKNSQICTKEQLHQKIDIARKWLEENKN